VFVLLSDQVLLPMESIVSPVELSRVIDEAKVANYVTELGLGNELAGLKTLSFEGVDLVDPVEIYCVSQMKLFV